MLVKIKKSQSVVEYSIFIAALVGGIIGLQIYFQRAVKDNFKTRSDAVGGQFTTTQPYTIEKQSSTLRSTDSGYLVDGGKTYWSKSKILAADGESAVASADWLDDVTSAELTYSGNELSKTDYVSATAGGAAVGTHGTFDSGTIATITPWVDAGIE